MSDKYGNYEELIRGDAGEGYALIHRKGQTGCAIIAPHGGGIEPGTLELADAIAGNEHSYFAFDAKKRSGNFELHITSGNYDVPECVEIVAAAHTVVAVHGCHGQESTVYLGGLDDDMKKKCRNALIAEGFAIGNHDDAELQGESASNICNRGKTKRGVQFELPEGLRGKMFAALNREGRKVRTDIFDRFVRAIRKALA